ncbi:MAG: hypothetical protein R3B45_12385 [Bdellovibrionota bacterium]
MAIASTEYKIAGTPERQEFEYKIAFLFNEEITIKNILQSINQELKTFGKNNKLKFPLLFKSKYELKSELTPFVFKDFYLDTKNLDILRKKSSYRLRYRWNSLKNYSGYKFIPFISTFDPTRCEVQFKRSYQTFEEEGAILVNESRFEFRNEADPFILKSDAPPPPWPIQSFLGYAISGIYKKFKMLPMQIVEQVLSKKNPDLTTVATVETVRYRTHVTMKNNPWHWGANPDHVFIISLDLSRWTYNNGNTQKTRLLEIEIEADRNTSTFINLLANITPQSELESLSQKKAINAKKSLEEDQKRLKAIISMAIKKLHFSNPLPTQYKYARIMENRQ